MEDASDQHAPSQNANESLPPPQPVPEDRAPNTNPRAAEGEQEKEASNPFDIAMLRWTRVVGLFTAVLAFVGIAQTWAFIQSERAFVSPASLSFHPPSQSDRSATFDLQIKNSGRSTANIKHNVYTISYKLAETPNYPPMKDVTLSPVVPGGSIQFQINTGLLPDDAFKALSGQYTFFIYGYLDYEDEFSIMGLRKDGWCFAFNPKGSTPNVSQFTSCDNAKYTYSK